MNVIKKWKQELIAVGTVVLGLTGLSMVNGHYDGLEVISANIIGNEAQAATIDNEKDIQANELINQYVYADFVVASIVNGEIIANTTNDNKDKERLYFNSGDVMNGETVNIGDWCIS